MAELGQTKDPKELIPGNPEAVNNVADTLSKRGEVLESIAHGLGRVETPGWTGDASTAFWDNFSGEKPKWLKGSDAMSAASKALTGHASVLTWAQSQAQDAIDVWERGEASTKKAVDEYNTALDTARVQAAAGHPATDPPTFSDPGEKLRQQARDYDRPGQGR